MIAIVRVRGRFNIKPKIRKTLELLKLNKPNHCVVYYENPSILGMLKVVENYVTYGTISEEFAKELAERKQVPFENGMLLRLHPPIKGWKSIKLRYPKGALGKRDNMEELLKRMM